VNPNPPREPYSGFDGCYGDIMRHSWILWSDSIFWSNIGSLLRERVRLRRIQTTTTNCKETEVDSCSPVARSTGYSEAGLDEYRIQTTNTNYKSTEAEPAFPLQGSRACISASFICIISMLWSSDTPLMYSLV